MLESTVSIVGAETPLLKPSSSTTNYRNQIGFNVPQSTVRLHGPLAGLSETYNVKTTMRPVFFAAFD